jgi:outer membrane immunogenic protein
MTNEFRAGRTVGEVIVKNILLAGIALMALAAPAAAADMPLKAPAPVAVDIWTGGYVGVNVGYDWGSDRVDSTGSPGQCTAAVPGCVTFPNYYSQLSAQAATFQTSVTHNGVIYGGQAGHNWLVHNMFWTWDGVLGVEVDFQGKSDSHSATYATVAPSVPFPAQPVSQTATLNEKLTTLGTVRGRAGLLWGPSTLIYATAGVAFASAQATATYNQNVPFVGAPPANIGPYGASGSVNTELFGPVVGGGIEWKWTPNLSIKAEYLYADLGAMSFNTNALINPVFGTSGSLSVATANVQTHIHDNIARVGVNYRLW